MSFDVESQPGTNQVILENVPEVDDIPDNAVFIARTAIEPTTWRVLSVRETAKNEFQVGALEHNPSKYAFIEEGLELEEDVTSVFPTGALAPPISLVASEVEYTEMGGAFIRLTLSIEAPIDPRIVGYAIETIAPSGVVGLLGPSRELTYEIENATVGDWEFKAFSLDAQGSRSVATAIDYTVVGADQSAFDGQGLEFLFARSALSALPQSQYPDNGWGYKTPGVRGNLQWNTTAPTRTETTPYIHLTQREAPGEPDIGDEITGAWSSPPELLSNADGTGILNIERDSTTGIITVTFTDGRTQLFSVSDGRDGKTLERIFIRTQTLNTPADPCFRSGHR